MPIKDIKRPTVPHPVIGRVALYIVLALFVLNAVLRMSGCQRSTTFAVTCVMFAVAFVPACYYLYYGWKQRLYTFFWYTIALFVAAVTLIFLYPS